MRGRLLRRLAALLAEIEGLRYMPSLRDLSARLGVCERTVMRDLAALEEAGFRLPKRQNEMQRVA